MRNPWLDVPLADYEAHMALPQVGQAQLLRELLGAVLDECAPRSVAVLGCAGGNGLEQAVARGLERVVGIDLNPDYVASARARFTQVPSVELEVRNLETDSLGIAPVELVYAGLLFEHVDPAQVLDRVLPLLAPAGTLVAVLQLPSAAVDTITPSPFMSLKSLAAVMHLVPPERLRELAVERGYVPLDARTVPTSGGKRLHVETFRAPADGGGASSRAPSSNPVRRPAEGEER